MFCSVYLHLYPWLAPVGFNIYTTILHQCFYPLWCNKTYYVCSGYLENINKAEGQSVETKGNTLGQGASVFILLFRDFLFLCFFPSFCPSICHLSSFTLFCSWNMNCLSFLSRLKARGNFLDMRPFLSLRVITDFNTVQCRVCRCRSGSSLSSPCVLGKLRNRFHIRFTDRLTGDLTPPLFSSLSLFALFALGVLFFAFLSCGLQIIAFCFCFRSCKVISLKTCVKTQTIGFHFPVEGIYLGNGDNYNSWIQCLHMAPLLLH